MRAIREAGIALAGDLWAHIVADEEVVGQSTRHLLRRLPAVDAVLVAEPTDLAIMPVEGGLVHFRIEIDGRESHAGNRYMSVHAGGLGNRAGVNAIEKVLRVVTALQDLERQWGNFRHHPMLPAGFNTIMPGIIVGGPGGELGSLLLDQLEATIRLLFRQQVLERAYALYEQRGRHEGFEQQDWFEAEQQILKPHLRIS